MAVCLDCGCKVYNGACTNCDEAIYIANQYDELGMDLPDESTQFYQDLIEAEKRQDKRLRNKE